MTDKLSRRFLRKLQVVPVWLRTIIGFLLIGLGFLGFLPVLGFWMIPLGLLVLSADYRVARYLYVQWRLFWRYMRRRTGIRAKRNVH